MIGKEGWRKNGDAHLSMRVGTRSWPYFKKSLVMAFGYAKDCGKFCCSFPPKPPGERAKKDYLVSAAGAAAERLIYGNNDSDAAGADRRDFDTPDSPSPEETINGACGILSGKKRHLKRLISMLKAKVRQVDFDLGRLPEQGMEGSEKRYLILLNKEELEAAMHRR
jgi:hypothetical protein